VAISFAVQVDASATLIVGASPVRHLPRAIRLAGHDRPCAHRHPRRAWASVTGAKTTRKHGWSSSRWTRMIIIKMDNRW